MPGGQQSVEVQDEKLSKSQRCSNLRALRFYVKYFTGKLAELFCRAG